MKGGKATAEGNRSNATLKRKGADSQRAGKKAAKNAAKDPNKPKRPSSAFFVFMEDFRVQYKQKHPNNKSVAAVGKAGGDKWKSLSDAEKAPYIAKSEKRKEEYNKKMQAYNKRSAEGANAAVMMMNRTSQSLRLTTKRKMMTLRVERTRRTMIKSRALISNVLELYALSRAYFISARGCPDLFGYLVLARWED